MQLLKAGQLSVHSDVVRRVADQGESVSRSSPCEDAQKQQKLAVGRALGQMHVVWRKPMHRQPSSVPGARTKARGELTVQMSRRTCPATSCAGGPHLPGCRRRQSRQSTAYVAPVVPRCRFQGQQGCLHGVEGWLASLCSPGKHALIPRAVEDAFWKRYGASRLIL